MELKTTENHLTARSPIKDFHIIFQLIPYASPAVGISFLELLFNTSMLFHFNDASKLGYIYRKF
jgi:hypothetical protein